MTLNEQFLQDATNGYAKILGDQIRKDPTLLVPVSLTDALKNVINRKAAFPGVRKKTIYCIEIYSR